MLTDYENKMMRPFEVRDDVRKRSTLVYPKPSCPKCYGRGVMGYRGKTPVPCDCVAKGYEKAMRKSH